MGSRLVWITPDAEQVISDCARVSNPSNQGKDGTQLIAYLMQHKHWSPFEMASACFEISTSLAVATQMLRHRSFSFQQFSQRYSKVVSLEPIEMRKQAAKNRQSSTDVIDDEDINYALKYGMSVAKDTYHYLVGKGVARETARMVLPQCSTTTLYMAGSLRSWIHYLELRTAPDTQKEHRVIAINIQAVLAEKCPLIFST